MPKQLTGTLLEEKGREIFDKMQLHCIGNLSNVRLADLNPKGSNIDEQLEIDYLIPYGEVCLVGEITSRTPEEARRKYKKFRRHFDFLREVLQNCTSDKDKTNFWYKLGVTQQDHLRKLRSVINLKAFMICSEFERLEGSLEAVEQFPLFFRYEWSILCEYAECLGPHAAYPFLDSFGIRPVRTTTANRPLKYSVKKGNLLSVQDRYVTSDRDHTSHVLTFLASPYEIIPLARVYRRDTLPSLDDTEAKRYQRMLVRSKLENIRKKLLTHSDFIFPNSILAVLSKNCYFDRKTSTLTIDDNYGSINVVDGQHRLFAYACDSVPSTLKSECRILVTAISFDGVEERYISRFSAKTFIEINTNQTSVPSSHLFGIAYEVFGSTESKDLAAHILRMVNGRKNALRGLLLTSDSPSGRMKSMEIVRSLSGITNLQQVAIPKRKISQEKREKTQSRHRGYEQLFGCSIEELQDANIMVQQGVICIEHYFNVVQKVFKHDWPSVSGPDNGSAFELTKMFAALVRLLKEFIEEGLTWGEVEVQMKEIQKNIMEMGQVVSYTSPLLLVSDKNIPDARARIQDDFLFLNQNRFESASLASVLGKE